MMSINATLLLLRLLRSCRTVVNTNFKPANYGTLTSRKAKLETYSTTTITLLAALVVTKLFRMQIAHHITTKVSTLLSILLAVEFLFEGRKNIRQYCLIWKFHIFSKNVLSFRCFPKKYTDSNKQLQFLKCNFPKINRNLF